MRIEHIKFFLLSYFLAMESKTFYGTRTSSTNVEHQEETFFENELSDEDIFEPDDSSSISDSSAEDTGDSSCD